ncbi:MULTISPECIES: putative bifunctional diguanylate cyclase/phosphodiesterase [Vibrio]|uniref:Diguanylate phosphodiesterase n=1 Tax=Vibrio bivalvicida TaxID=1276888 RepID=A0A177XV18_9VIBR|nr:MULTISPECIES: bifunctional diguanylate cyclase/phosphodiesterase [Vibrio]KLN65746.1 diguanylate phosphodiesterase [Vibrio sp. VPAP30]OAJ92417.1 diguanylate phosphodiesterase [Vibrio bivalvicida]
MQQLFKVNEAVQVIAYIAYIVAVGVMSHSFLLEPHPWELAYYLFPFLLLLALYSNNSSLKHVFAFSATALFLVGGLVQPFPLELIQECLFFLPLCYIVLFPGSLWPIAVCAALINGYLYQLTVSDFHIFVDTSIQMTSITVFATLMTYFFVKTQQQAASFKTESQTDYLTKLPNVNAYKEDIERITEHNAKHFGMLHIGLEAFKNVNDRLGYRYGDELLVAFSKHIKDIVGTAGKVYRFGGDEFIVVVEHKDLQPKLEELVDELNHHQRAMFDVDNTSHRLSYCIGVAYAADALGSPEVWEKNADFALYKARSVGGGSVCWFDDELLGETIRQHQIETEIRSALSNHQFVLLFQPKVDVDSVQIVGAEALLRWNHPQLGPIPPSEFIPIAEKTTQIVPVGHWIIHEACRQAKQYYDQKLPICIAVNVSTVQFAHADLFEVVCNALKETQLPSHLLQLEITESTLMSDPDNITDICRQLRAIGVSIAIDDFGVEYSSLKYLKQLPIDVIKIDKCFIDECAINHSDRILVRTIIQMGHSLGIKLVAEGVEFQEQLDILVQEQCDQYQGYLFSRPLSHDEFGSMMTQQIREKRVVKLSKE